MVRRLLFYNFRFVFKLDKWIRKHFTSAGLLVLSGFVAAGIFGIDTKQTMAYQLFTLLATLLFFAMLSSLFFRVHFTVKRKLPRFATVEEKLDYRVTIYNDTQKVQKDLTVLENIKLNPPDFKTFLAAKEPLQTKRNWFDNYVGYPRWVWLTSLSKGADLEKTALPTLLPKDTIEVKMQLTPLRRGYIHLQSLSFARPDPLGLFNAIYTVDLPESLLVLPKRYPVPILPLTGSRKYQRGGLQLAMSVGDAQEFMALREYRAGDPLKHIHWKSFAKLGEPIVKEFQDEFFVSHALILDTFTTKPTSQTFEAAVSVAASFVCAPRDQDTLLNLMFVEAKAYAIKSGRGLSQTDELLEILACVQACTDKPFSTVMPLIRQHIPVLSAAICIFLEWDDERQQLVKLLESHQIPLLVFVIQQVPQPTQLKLQSKVHFLHLDTLAEQLQKVA